MTIKLEFELGHRYDFIASTVKEDLGELFKAICLYDFEILDNDSLAEVFMYAGDPRSLLKDREHQKEALRNFAKEYQRAQAELSTSYEELAFWASFFRTYGEKLGLIEEFEENGIL